MTTFLIKVEIEHINYPHPITTKCREFGLIEAETYGDAEYAAKLQATVDSLSPTNLKPNTQKWWIENNQIAKVTVKGIEPIDDEDAEFLQCHGIAYFIDRES